MNIFVRRNYYYVSAMRINNAQISGMESVGLDVFTIHRWFVHVTRMSVTGNIITARKLKKM